MQDLTPDRQRARHRGPARSAAVVVRQRARTRSVALAALALLFVATVLLYGQIQVRKSQPGAAQGPPDGVAVTAVRSTSVAIPAGRSDAETITAGRSDAVAVKAGRSDAGTITAGRSDAVAVKAGRSDAGTITAGRSDAVAVREGESDAVAVADELVPPPTAPSDPGESAASARWRRVLEQLNDTRHTAWLRGDPRLLGEVYLPRSPALALDREVLRDYLSRGLRVHGVRLHFGRVHVLSRAPGLVSLRVVDRLGAMTATASGGTVLPLPIDQPTRHRIVLQSLEGRWRIAAVSTR